MQLTYNEIIDILDLEYNGTKRIGFSLKPNIYQISDINDALKSILPDIVKLSVSIDEKKYKTELKINQTLIITNKMFFFTTLRFTQSHSYPLDDIDGFYQLISGSYKIEKPINITGTDKVHLKCNCIDGSIVNGIREPILYSFALDQPPGPEIYKEPKVRLFKKTNRSVLSHITFFLEDYDYKAVDFNGEPIIFTCQLIKIYNMFSYNFIYMYTYD